MTPTPSRQQPSLHPLGGSGKLGLQVVNGSHLGKRGGKIVTLLVGDLSRWWVAREGTVTNGIHVLGTLDLEVLVDKQASSGAGLSLDLADQVVGEIGWADTSGPHKHTVWDLFLLHGTVLLFRGGGDRGGSHFVHGCVEDELDVVLGKRLLGIRPQALGERVQHVRERLDQGDLDLLGDGRHPLGEVLVHIVLQFSGKLDTRRASSHNDKVQQSLSLLASLRIQRSFFNALQEALSDLDRVRQLFQETSVLGNARNVESGWLCTDSNDQVVVLELLDELLRIGAGTGKFNFQSIFRHVDICSVGLDVSHLCRSSLGDRSDWLDDRSGLDGSSRRRRQQRREQKVASRRNNGHIVQTGIEIFEHRCGTPSAPKNNNALFLCSGSSERGLGLLVSGVSLSVDGGTHPGGGQNSADGTNVQRDPEQLVEKRLAVSGSRDDGRAESSCGDSVEAHGPSCCQHNLG
ncbi:hypothetical protein OGATHE_004925 [Ogataea polymorpha]|uniref:Uncharacterized protein n=1 Tax=Ogataea polymorpha TaxID=460523 RepID=A0A9P8NUI9_9ASCO|nr:hypothetical protein OGATHE_004925 [Ogataea polymorpha]